MLTLPAGMQDKIDSAQQTLYNSAQPEIKIEAFIPAVLAWELEQGIGNVLTKATDIAAVSRTSIYVCGVKDTQDGDVAAIAHWNGATWSTMEVPVGLGWTLSAIHAFSDDLIYCTGYANEWGGPYGEPTGENCILKWNGSAWIGESYPSTWTNYGATPFYDVWGADPEHIWAFGRWGAWMYYNGLFWTEVRAPDPYLNGDNIAYYLTKVLGTEPDNMYAVGDHPYIWQNKGSWTPCFNNNYGGNVKNYHLSMPAESTCYVYGENDSGAMIWMTTNHGATWKRLTIPSEMLGTASPDNGIFALNNDSIFVGCENGVWHFSGYGWQFQEVIGGTGSCRISQFWAFSSTDVIGVGWGLGSNVYPAHHSVVVEGGDDDYSEYLCDGSITVAGDTPISSVQLAMENPDGYLVSETDSRLKVGQGIRVFLRFAGESESTDWFSLGRYFIDRITTDPLKETLSIDARNTIGRQLQDQPVPPASLYTIDTPLGERIAMMIVECGVSEVRVIAPTSDDNKVTMSFDRQSSALDAINELLRVCPWWRMVERYDGMIVVGPPEGTEGGEEFADNFPPVSTYSFSRGRDIWSRDIVIDDDDAYSFVCVRTAPQDISGEEMGTGNGMNRLFKVEHTPIEPGSVSVEVNGQPAVIESIDYLSGDILLAEAPPDEKYEPNKTLVKSYCIMPTASGDGAPNSWQLHGSNDNFVSHKVVLHSGWKFDWDGEEVLFQVVHPGEYRWYSIEIFKAANYTNPNILEIRFLDANGDDVQPTMTSNDEPVPYVVEASSSFSADRLPFQAFDGNAETRWIAGFSPDWWIKLDFGRTSVEGAAPVIANYESSLSVFCPVTPHSYLMVPANKTLFVEVAQNTKVSDCEDIAAKIANQIESCGKLETFDGPIRPQLWPGDSAYIDPGGVVGTIMSVTHRIGKEGFSTSFTVDSGKKVGNPTIQSLLNKKINRSLVDKPIRVYSDT